MQKVLRRNLLARNQALKRQRRETEEKLNQTKRKIRQEHVSSTRLKTLSINAERRNRREDWVLGPLAPNRVAGKDGGGYGMLAFQVIQVPTVLKTKREKYFNFAKDDRVVVVKGTSRGKIGKVTKVDEEKQTVELDGINMVSFSPLAYPRWSCAMVLMLNQFGVQVDIIIPPYMREQAGSQAPYLACPMPIPIQDVRLVVPLRDHATGKVKDTVVEHLEGGGPFREREYGSSKPKHRRWIAGLNVTIPWPKSEVLQHQAKAADTLRIDVDVISFATSFQGLPLPNSALDEVRNKYSKTRSVHTPKYIQQKMKEDAEDQWKKRRRMVLPQQENWEWKAAQKKEQGKTKVTRETLDLIKDMRVVNLSIPDERTSHSAF